MRTETIREQNDDVARERGQIDNCFYEVSSWQVGPLDYEASAVISRSEKMSDWDLAIAHGIDRSTAEATAVWKAYQNLTKLVNEEN